MSVKLDFPHFGHGSLFSLMYETLSSFVRESPKFELVKSLIKLSARYLVLHSLQSINGSLNVLKWPLASHVLGFINIALSKPTLFISS